MMGDKTTLTPGVLTVSVGGSTVLATVTQNWCHEPRLDQRNGQTIVV